MSIPVSDVDSYSDAVILDPYPVYNTLRELGPVVYLKKNDLYVVLRCKDVSKVAIATHALTAMIATYTSVCQTGSWISS